MKDSANQHQSQTASSAASTTLKRLAVVMEFDTDKGVFNFVKKKYGEGFKIMPLCSNILTKNASLGASRRAIRKGKKFSAPDLVDKKPFFYKDEKGEYEISLYFGCIMHNADISGEIDCEVVEIKPEDVLGNPEITDMTKFCFEVLLEKQYLESA